MKKKIVVDNSPKLMIDRFGNYAHVYVDGSYDELNHDGSLKGKFDPITNEYKTINHTEFKPEVEEIKEGVDNAV